MCGIAGYFSLDNKRHPDRNVLERMAVALRHRGPDGYGFYRGRGAGLAHARLSIIDLSAGWQPLSNEDGSLWIVFNGEIFNYPELRRDLLRRGHTFATASDTEVIIHLYEEKGWQCLEELNGQFALAIYDVRKEELFLARDRMGIRPLFYTLHDGTFSFASEIKALFNGDRNLPRRFNLQSLGDIFTFWTPTVGATVFEGVHQLPAGHWLTVGRSGVAPPRRYWEMPLNADPAGSVSENDYAEQLRELLIDSVRLRLRADVPVGAYLSGGLDSAAITSLIRHYTPNSLKTFSVSFTDKVYDEAREQQQMVAYLNTDHHQVRCGYGDIARIFPEVVRHTEIPILRTAPSPLYLLSRLVRENDYKVVLTGEGADEILGGYDIFKEAKIRAFIHRQPNSSLRPLLLKRLYPYLALSPTRSAEYARTFFETGASPDDPHYAHRPRWKTTRWSHLFFTPELAAAAAGTDSRLEGLAGDLEGLDFFQRAQFTEAKLLLGNYLLCSQGDRMAMAHSIEGRFPFLDHRVVELAGRIPAQLKMKVLNEKNILKKAVADILPPATVRRRKQPYMAPDIQSFFGEEEPDYLAYYLSDDLLRQAGLFKKEGVNQLVGKCRRRNRQGFRENMAFTGILSSQIIYDTFIRDFPFTDPAELPDAKVDVDHTGTQPSLSRD